MKAGGGKAKGSSFERAICRQLSLWVSNGKKTDCFWRSAISGGRATVSQRKGTNIRQAGDICAVAPEGHALTSRWFIECKHVRDLALDSFLLSNTGPLAQFWRTARKQAASHGRQPMIIARQNRGPVIVITPIGALDRYLTWSSHPPSGIATLTSHAQQCDIATLDDLVKLRRVAPQQPRKRYHQPVTRSERTARNRKIVAMRKQGRNLKTIADKFDLSEQRVFQIFHDYQARRTMKGR